MDSSPSKVIAEVRNQLSYSKRIGFFLGAGASKSVGLPDITELTLKVESVLEGAIKDGYEAIKGSLQHENKTVEDILNQTRLIRQITFGEEAKSFEGVSGKAAKDVDVAVCNKIYEIINSSEEQADILPMQKFVNWLDWHSRDFSKEIFTPNYDLLLEKAFENQLIPYFDGFVGAHEPFFLSESLESNPQNDNVPLSWIRLWKIHGSLGWFWKENKNKKSYRVVRLGVNAKKSDSDNELVIYPSRDKYETSRKQPFIAYFDRLKSFLLSGEGLFIISGYSFSDEHINAVLFDGLRQNNRLHIIGFFYDDVPIDYLIQNDKRFLNFSAIGAKKGIVKGQLVDWSESEAESIYWDQENKKMKLGDFKLLVDFFLSTSGRSEDLDKELSTSDEK